jgi:hypothetical protein
MAEISKQALLVDNNQSFPDNNSGAITPVDLRSFNVDLIDSTVNQAVYTTDSGSWNAQIGQLNAFTASQQPSFTALNTFTASQLTINSGVNGFTQSAGSSITQLNQATASLQNFTSSINQIIVNGASIGTSTRLFFNGFVSASIVPNVDGAIASITVLSDPSKLDSSSFNSYTASTAATQSVFSASVATSISSSSATFTAFSQSQNSFNLSATASLVELLNLSSSLSGGYATQGELDASSSTLQNNINVSSSVLQGNINVLSSFTGSYATTGSNTFTGDQTLIDAAGNSITLSDASGSLMLVAKGFTSASAHMSASAAGIGNIIFKTNNNTADTIISGSNNIFTNALAPIAGFKRYIGGNNNLYTAITIPQISGSMQFSPSMNRNIGSFAVPIRGPISSSAYNISDNLVMGGVVNLGTAVAPFTGMVAGYNFNQNILAGGTINQTANKNTLDAAGTFNSNIVFGATLNINNNSSSLNYFSNIQNGGITINNNYTPTVGSVGPRRVAVANINTVYGVNHKMDIGGTSTSTLSVKSATANLLAGTYITASLEETGDNASMVATSLIGNGLIVSGTSVTPTTANVTADATYGTVISGRFNAVDGNKAKTAQTVFAVGTGTSYANRKTGFLIDSGSNTFVEGTFNISGSLSYTGSVYGNVSASAIASSTASIDLSVANYFTLTLSGSTRLNITNPQPGVTATLVINTSTGASASFSSNVKQPSGSFYAASPSGNIDIISFTAVDSTTVYAFPAQSFV